METIKERKKKATELHLSATPPFPKELFLDLTSYCNHACVFCANSMIKQKSSMTPDLAKRVLREAYENGTRDVGLYATGEPFLAPDLAEFISYAKEIGYEYTFITTNGALVTPEKAKGVLDAGLDSIKFSISAGKRETYKEIQGRDDFEKVIANLKWVSQYRKGSGLAYRIYVTMVFTDRTQDEVELLKDIVMPYVDEWDPHYITNQCGNMYENNELGTIDDTNPRGRGRSEICFQPFKSFTVTPEGLVSACVLDYSRDLIVGDLSQTTLKEAWNNSTYRSFRKHHMEKNLKGLICFNCMHNKNEPVTPLLPEYAQHFKE